MPLIQFSLTIEILQILIINIQNKLLRKKIVSPILQCLNSSIKFLIINIIFSFSIIQIHTKISNMSTFLAQNCSYCSTSSITVYLKHLVKIRRCQNRLSIIFCFNRLKLIYAPIVHLNSFLSPLIILVKGPQILLKTLMKFL